MIYGQLQRRKEYMEYTLQCCAHLAIPTMTLSVSRIDLQVGRKLSFRPQNVNGQTFTFISNIIQSLCEFLAPYIKPFSSFSQSTHHIIEVTTLKCNEETTTSRPKTTLRTTVQQRNRPHETSGWSIIARLFTAFQQCSKSYSTIQQCATTKYQRCRRRCGCQSKHRAQCVAIAFTYFDKRRRLWH